MRRAVRAALLPCTALLVLSVAVAAPGAAVAQQIRAVELERISGFVELGVDSDREQRKRDGGSFEVNELELRELLHVDLSGYVYHPRFLVYNGSGELELIQELEDGDDQTLLGGTWRLSLLPEHRFGLAVFGDRRESDVDQAFARSYERTTDLYGVAFLARRGPVPLEASLRHREITGSSRGPEVKEEADEFRVDGRYQLSESSRGRLQYVMSDEEIRGSKVEHAGFSVNNATGFAGGKRLFSTFGWDDRDNGTQTERWSLSESFHWPHRETLRSAYSFDFQSDEMGDQDVDAWDATASVWHRLYESLTSQLTLRSRVERASFGDMNRFGASLNENYTKRLSDWGRLNIGLAPYAELEQNNPDQDIGFVLDEAQRLVGLAGSDLAQLDVLLPTVVVHDTDGDCTGPPDPGGPGNECLRGLDYELDSFGPRVEIRRLALGDISDGEQVFVDYEHQLLGDGDILSTGLDLRVDVALPQGWFGLPSLKPWVYWTFNGRDQDEVSGEVGRLESRTRNVVGIRLEHGWGTGQLEYERKRLEFEGGRLDVQGDGDSGSFDAVTGRLAFVGPLRWSFHTRLALSHRHLEYTGDGQELERSYVIAHATRRLLRRGLLEFSAEYHRERWSGLALSSANDVDALGLKGAFTWRMRRVLVTLEVRFSDAERHGQDERTDRVTLFVRRNF